jgi:hypothetical protein
MEIDRLNGVLWCSDIPKEAIKTGKNGRKYLPIEVCKRKVPGKFGDTHYIKVSIPASERKEGVNYFIGDLKPSRFAQQEQETAAMPTPKDVEYLNAATQSAPVKEVMDMFDAKPVATNEDYDKLPF